ncbi:MAG: hypothetical protein ACUVTP_03665 [Candidatus Fervidibacter sp.]|uniref:hypothetical protein n=1 Tax=Candidatus Fervidibacter sp. TaxID=3100871 RepID=UPI00404B7DDE
MRPEKVWHTPSVPAETERIREVRERKNKNPQRQTPPAPILSEQEPEEEQGGENQKTHLDTLV